MGGDCAMDHSHPGPEPGGPDHAPTDGAAPGSAGPDSAPRLGAGVPMGLWVVLLSALVLAHQALAALLW